MGMLTHVHTFDDLSDAGLTETWGWRYGRRERDEVFQGTNPYRTMEISDRFGIHSKIENPPLEDAKVATISKIYWFFSDQRPDWIPAKSVKRNEDGHLLAHVELSYADLERIYSRLGGTFVFAAEGKPEVLPRAERGHWNSECYLRIPKTEMAKMVPGVPYTLSVRDQRGEYRWRVEDDVTITLDE